MEVDADGGSLSANVGVALAGTRPGVIVAVCDTVGVGLTGVGLDGLVANAVPAGSGATSPQAANKAALRITMIDFSTPLIILYPPFVNLITTL